MSIPVIPHQLTLQDMKVRIQPNAGILPGSLVRLNGNQSAYGQVTEVTLHADGAEALATLNILYGQPGFDTQTVTILDDEELAGEVQRLQGAIAQPLQIGQSFTADWQQFGHLTVIAGDDLVMKYRTLWLMIQALQVYRPLCIVDPLGLFEPGDGVACYEAGSQFRLSVQHVGAKRFLSTFADMFTDAVRDQAITALADQLPNLSDRFVPFNHLLNPEVAFPFRNLIWQNYQSVLQAGVFAVQEDQVFHPGMLGSHRVSVLDLSHLEAPWQRLFYQSLCDSLLSDTTPQSALPVLIYPEQFCPDLAAWVQKADETDCPILAVSGSYGASRLDELADNLLVAQHPNRLQVEGDLTLGLPVSLSLPGLEHTDTHPTAPAIPSQDMPSAASAIVDLNAPQPEPLPATLTLKNENEAISGSGLLPHGADAPTELPEAPWPAEDPAIERTWTEEPIDRLPTIALADLNEHHAGLSDDFPGSHPQSASPTDVFSAPDEDDFNFELDLDQDNASLSPATEALWATDIPPDASLPDQSLLHEEHRPHSATGSGPLMPEPPAMPVDIIPPIVKKAESDGVGLVEQSTFQPGDRVRHETYGLGLVNKVIPMDQTVILNITFEHVGKRLLDPALCQLHKESS